MPSDNYTTDGFRAFLEAHRDKTELKTGVGRPYFVLLRPEKTALLIEFLRDNKTLRYLDLSPHVVEEEKHNTTVNENIRAIAKALEENEHLQQLVIRADFPIEDETLDAVKRLLQHNYTLYSMQGNFGFNLLGPTGKDILRRNQTLADIEEYIERRKNERVGNATIFKTEATEKSDFHFVIGCLTEHEETLMEIESGAVTSSHGDKLAKKTSTLREELGNLRLQMTRAKLFWNDRNIDDNDMPSIIPQLTRETRTLSLSNNQLGDPAAAALTAYLYQSNCHLETLYLANNRIGNGGAAALAGPLKDNTHLRTLVLAGNSVENNTGDNTAADAFADALKYNTVLVTLTGVPYANGHRLAAILKRNQNLQAELDASERTLAQDIGIKRLLRFSDLDDAADSTPREVQPTRNQALIDKLDRIISRLRKHLDSIVEIKSPQAEITRQKLCEAITRCVERKVEVLMDVPETGDNRAEFQTARFDAFQTLYGYYRDNGEPTHESCFQGLITCVENDGNGTLTTYFGPHQSSFDMILLQAVTGKSFEDVPTADADSADAESISRSERHLKPEERAHLLRILCLRQLQADQDESAHPAAITSTIFHSAERLPIPLAAYVNPKNNQQRKYVKLLFDETLERLKKSERTVTAAGEDEAQPEYLSLMRAIAGSPEARAVRAKLDAIVPTLQEGGPSFTSRSSCLFLAFKNNLPIPDSEIFYFSEKSKFFFSGGELSPRSTASGIGITLEGTQTLEECQTRVREALQTLWELNMLSYELIEPLVAAVPPPAPTPQPV